MRALRILALLGALAVVAVVGRDYFSARSRFASSGAKAPEKISSRVASQSRAWSWNQSTGAEQAIYITAGGFRQDLGSSGIELEEVRLEIRRDAAGTFDRVVTETAVFDPTTNLFYSEGEVTVTLGLPLAASSGGKLEAAAIDESRLTRITTSGASFNTRTGTADTEREAFYRFDGGRGRSVGAHYDSARRYFHMKSQARVERFAPAPGAAATYIKAGSLYYHELDQRIDLREGCSLVRGTQTIEAAEGEVRLADGRIRSVAARSAIGSDRQPTRTVRFRTPNLEAFYAPDGSVEQVVGSGPSELSSGSANSRLIAAGDRVDLRYRVAPEHPDDSLLDEADLRGQASVVSIRLGQGPEGQRRSVGSEWIHLKMRPNGEDPAWLETLAAGRVELAPLEAAPGARRELRAERVRIDYGERASLEKLTARGDAELESRPADPGQPPLRTWSNIFEAFFDPASGEMSRLVQSEKFRFEQGERKGNADRGTYVPSSRTMILESQARVSDPSGSVFADRIELDEANQGIKAQGQVASVYSEGAAPATDSTLFSSSEPVHATAQRMRSDQSKGTIIYEGAARLWQQRNRISGETIEINRRAGTLKARGGVTSRLIDQPEPAESAAAVGKEAAPVAVDIRADALDYVEAEQRATYSGAVEFRRAGLMVTCKRLEALLGGEGDDSTGGLRAATATGDVEIREIGSGRRGFGERADYDPRNEHVLLEGTPARAVNALGERTQGAELTYRVGDDSLSVRGRGEQTHTYRRR